MSETTTPPTEPGGTDPAPDKKTGKGKGGMGGDGCFAALGLADAGCCVLDLLGGCAVVPLVVFALFLLFSRH